MAETPKRPPAHPERMGSAGRVFAWAGIALGGLLVLSYIVAVTVYVEAKPYIEREFPTPIYERSDDCAMPCTSIAARDNFLVETGMREVHFVMYARLDASTGPARVTITDPSGDVRYERLFGPDTSGAAFAIETQDSAQWSAELGEWTLTRSYLGVQGHIDYETWGIGLPPGTL